MVNYILVQCYPIFFCNILFPFRFFVCFCLQIDCPEIVTELSITMHWCLFWIDILNSVPNSIWKLLKSHIIWQCVVSFSTFPQFPLEYTQNRSFVIANLGNETGFQLMENCTRTFVYSILKNKQTTISVIVNWEQRSFSFKPVFKC